MQRYGADKRKVIENRKKAEEERKRNESSNDNRLERCDVFQQFFENPEYRAEVEGSRSVRQISTEDSTAIEFRENAVRRMEIFNRIPTTPLNDMFSHLSGATNVYLPSSSLQIMPQNYEMRAIQNNLIPFSSHFCGNTPNDEITRRDNWAITPAGSSLVIDEPTTSLAVRESPTMPYNPYAFTTPPTTTHDEDPAEIAQACLLLLETQRAARARHEAMKAAERAPIADPTTSLAVRQLREPPTSCFDDSHLFPIPAVPLIIKKTDAPPNLTEIWKASVRAKATTTPSSNAVACDGSAFSTESLSQMFGRMRNIATPAILEEDRRRKELRQQIMQLEGPPGPFEESCGHATSSENSKRNREEQSSTLSSTDTRNDLQNAKRNRDDTDVSAGGNAQSKGPGRSGKSIIKKAFGGLIKSITKKLSPKKRDVSKTSVEVGGEDSANNAVNLNETPDEKRRREQRERKQRSRARQTEQQKKVASQSDAASRSRSRSAETTEQRERRLQLATASQRRRIATETEEQRQQRLQVATTSQRQRIDTETEEQRQRRLDVNALSQSLRRASETEEQRQQRLQVATTSQRQKIDTETKEQRQQRLDVNALSQSLRRASETFIHLNLLSSNLDPMTYAILYPYGEAGWHPGFTQEGRKVSMLEYKVAQTAIRDSFNPIISAGKLTQQWLVDSYLQVEANDLNFIRTKQNTLRRELYQGLQDHINDLAREQGVQAGVPVILPSSFSGSPRNMRERLQDAMSIFGKYGPMDAFVTFTANPKWDEITANLKPGETASDRPELVARVFKLKLKELIKDLTVNMVLGYVVAWVYTIEFQKRGLPHAHILLVFHEDDKFNTSEKIDNIISAELPDQQQNPRLYEIITRCMIHGPCGAANLNSVCMEDGKCKKRFPKEFKNETEPNVAGYPHYQRRRGPTATIGPNVVDNRWVIPYNPYLTAKYDCHINVEACTSLRAVKYIYKYIYKGFDCARVEIRQGENPRVNVNEISNYIEGRYISAPEGMWRLLKNKMHDRSHAIIRLPVHLPDQQSITFEEGREEVALDAARDRQTKLTAYFALNRQDAAAQNLLYTEIPLSYVFERSRWKQRERAFKIIPRMYTVSIKDEERFYLRVLLLHVRGATSFEDLRSVAGIEYPTFKEAAIQRHLLESDVEWEHCLDEAVVFQLPPQMRHTFAYICIFGEVADPLYLWEKFKEHMIIDFLRNYDEQSSINLALHDLNSIFHQHGQSCSNFHLPEPTGNALDVPTHDQQQLLAEVNRLMGTLNPEQKQAFDHIIEGVNSPTAHKLFYLNGPGGSGKTYLYRTLISYMHSRNLQVLPFATTGIASTLMEGGRTAHSGFGIPVPLLDVSISNIRPGTEKGKSLIGAKLIIIDEVTMLNKHGLRVINELLQRLMNNQLPFGGKVIVISGDFRQTLPVVRRASRAGIIEACLKSSVLWRNFVELSLVSNMRSVGQNTYNNWLLDIGIGNTPHISGLNDDIVQIPNQMIVSEREDLISSIFTNNIRTLTEDELAERVILCTTNSYALDINNNIIEELPGTLKTYYSADSISSDDETANMIYTTEFLNSCQPSGIPPHELRLKKGTIVMLLRNFNPKKGLCNGTRLIVRETHENSIRCEIISDCCKGDIVIIPRINMTPSDTDLPFTLKRRQFPVIPAFAVTINKSQGQTYERVGIQLNEPVFSHGQLYVALSRSKISANVKVFMSEGPRQGRLLNDNRYFTPNIVYSEVFD